jgi:hypothetical protein
VTYPPTPSGDDATRDFGAPPGGQPPAPAYPPGSAPVGGEPAPYPAPPAAYPTATYPAAAWPPVAPPQPPKRSMTWFWVTVSAVVVVAVFAIGAVGVVLLSRTSGDKGGSAAAPPTAGSSHRTEPTAEPTEEPAADPSDQVAMPDTVGGLHKTDNPAYAGMTDQLAGQMEGLMPSTAHVGVGVYDDPKSTLGIAMVMRMDLNVSSTAGAIDGAFTGIKGMGKVSGLHSIKAPAPLTGPGKCGNVESQGIQMAVCVAADGHTVSMAMFMERSAKDVEGLFNKIRLDLVP